MFFNLAEDFKDPKIMTEFCKMMMKIGIERALYSKSGEKRPSDRLDFRYIEVFGKLIVVILNADGFNKHEFMSKTFDAICYILD